MLETNQNANEQMQDLMNGLVLAGLAVTALAIMLVIFLGA